MTWLRLRVLSNAFAAAADDMGVVGVALGIVKGDEETRRKWEDDGTDEMTG